VLTIYVKIVLESCLHFKIIIKEVEICTDLKVNKHRNHKNSEQQNPTFQWGLPAFNEQVQMVLFGVRFLAPRREKERGCTCTSPFRPNQLDTKQI